MKDFGAEVRASMDVDQFLQQAVLLLDVNETSLEGIVDRIVKKVSPLLVSFALTPVKSPFDREAHNYRQSPPSPSLRPALFA